MRKKIIILSLILFGIDQISKITIGLFIKLNDSFVIIKNFFSLNYVHNNGAAFSILRNQRLLFILIGFIALFLLFNYIKDFKENNRNIIAFSFLFGGILGNLCDRLFLGYVRDFLSFKIFSYYFPVFNIGDSLIVIGVILLLIGIIKGEDKKDVRRKKH